MKHHILAGMAIALLAGITASDLSLADGTQATNGRERFFLKRQNCPWTQEMGKYIYECLKKNDGFNAHWCHNEAIDAFCPADENAIPHPTDAKPGEQPAGTPAEASAGKKG